MRLPFYRDITWNVWCVLCRDALPTSNDVYLFHSVLPTHSPAVVSTSLTVAYLLTAMEHWSTACDPRFPTITFFNSLRSGAESIIEPTLSVWNKNWKHIKSAARVVLSRSFVFGRGLEAPPRSPLGELTTLGPWPSSRPSTFSSIISVSAPPFVRPSPLQILATPLRVHPAYLFTRCYHNCHNKSA